MPVAIWWVCVIICLNTCKRLTFTGTNALVPRVIEFGVAGISAVLEPSASLSATTAFAGFLGDTTLAAGNRGSNNCCSERRGYVYGSKGIYEIHRHADVMPTNID